MALLTWNEDFLVGVQTLDNQHSVLFDLVNQLDDALTTGQTQRGIVAMLRKLLNYTRGHFSAEEAMMAAANFPGLAQHRIQHRDLTRQVEAFEVRCERGEGAANLQLLSFLRDWLPHHIQDADKAYGPWMNKRGVQ